MRPLVAAVALLVSTAPARAVDFVVTSTADTVDAAIDGVCADAAGECTLRAAIQEANATPLVEDLIELPAGKFVLKRTGAFEDAAATGDLDVLGPTNVDGDTAGTTIIQGRKDRVFDAHATLRLSNLTVTKGKAPKSDDDEEASGGGVRNLAETHALSVIFARNLAFDDAGAIANVGGIVTLKDVLLHRNRAGDDAGAMDNDGGTLDFENVTFEKNVAKDEAGAFESEVGGTVTGRNVTISGNKAKEAGGANAEQGGVVALMNATIARNKCKIGGCGVQNEDDGSTFTLTNSIVASNKKVDCSGTITSLGGNLDGGTSCGFAQPTDQSGAGDAGLSPKLVRLDLPVHTLEPGSPAIDSAIDGECPVLDQVGAARVDVPSVGSSTCDAGAVEFVPAP